MLVITCAEAAAATTAPPPAGAPRTRIDVRAAMRRGAPVAGAILAAVEDLPEGAVQMVDSAFEPSVLHVLLADRGLTHRSVRVGPRHVRTEYRRA